MLLAHMDECGAISVYHVGCGDMAYCFGPEDDGDEADDIMEHQGFVVGDAGLYLASAHGQDLMVWQLGSSKPTLKGTITAHQATVVQVRSCSLSAKAMPSVHVYMLRPARAKGVSCMMTFGATWSCCQLQAAAAMSSYPPMCRLLSHLGKAGSYR